MFEACTVGGTINCASINSSVRVIQVFGFIPLGNCSYVQIGNIIFFYDPIMINYVWITLNNTDLACIANIPGRSSIISTLLNINANQEVVLLNVTALYYRMVIIDKNCISNCIVKTFSHDLENKLKSAKLALYPVYNDLTTLGPYCLYGGSIDTTYQGAGYKCNSCSTKSIFQGPSCEVMDMTFNNTVTFFNVFWSDTVIDLRFSLFSNGIPGTVSVLIINNSTFLPWIEIIIQESSLILKIVGNDPQPINLKVDDQNWYDINLVVSTTNAILSVNREETLLIPLKVTQTSSFRSYYLWLNPNNTTIFNICLKNVIVNSEILDLYNPFYQSCCLDRCKCTANQYCDCRPFISEGNTACYCKPLYLPSGSTCVPSNIPMAQMTDSVTSTVSLNNIQLTKVDFSFQTLSINGTILTLALSTPIINVSIQILNNSLIINVTGNVYSINYNVSNGQIHNVTLNVKPFYLEMILDNNYNYTTYFVKWFTNNSYPVLSSVVNVQSVTYGPMQRPFNSTYNNLTTCLTPIRFNSMVTPLDIFPSNSPTFYPQCLNGPRCSSGIVNCSLQGPNQTCMDNEWQNTKCICIANFTSVNSTCTYNLCIVNPCLNNGTCFYNASSSNYSCSCTSLYNGNICQNSITLATLWWIAVLIVLLLLLILLIVLLVYCCCYRNATPASAPYISKINENIVPYNEQAGECDYNGPPIDFSLMKTALNNYGNATDNGLKKQMPELMNKKEEFDKNNNDLILDHPLEYGYEGFDSDNASISSIGSKSATSEIVVDNLDDIYNKT